MSICKLRIRDEEMVFAIGIIPKAITYKTREDDRFTIIHVINGYFLND